jgi:hypothetical protein
MPVLVDRLIDLPVKKFCVLSNGSTTSYNEYIYLLNPPIRGLNPVRSENKIPIGSRGFLKYLNTVSYNIGYLFELAKSCTTVYNTHILVGTIQSEMDQIGEISMLYCDNNISIVSNKKHSSYMILPICVCDIPQPIIGDLT